MDASTLIDLFEEFIEEHYKAQIFERLSKGNVFLVIDFSDLSIFSPETAEELLAHPEETIKAAELSLERFDIREELRNKFRIRFKNLPESQKVMIRNIRSSHIGFLISVEGLVRRKTDVRPQVVSTKFECPSCGNIIPILQLDTSFREPHKCGCGRKGHFRLISKELVDAQGMALEEVPESLEGGEQPKRIDVFLKEDLVSPISEKRTAPGSKILVNGIIKEVPIIKGGSRTTKFDLFIEANYIQAIEETFYDIEISEKDEKIIKELASDPKIYEKMVGSIAPSIFGYNEIKEALVLQLTGGIPKKRKDGVAIRGDLHVLLVGDPGSGKSQLLKRISTVAPKGRYVSGAGASGAGITAAVVKDDLLGGWGLEAGALVLSNNGVCCVDELDKMSSEDRSAMHEALEQQTISIAKANIQATLMAKTTVLAAANPKFGRFDPSGIIADQIDLPPTLINRFDLIFPIKDLPDTAKDEKMARHILDLHQEAEREVTEIPTEILRKYFAYARQTIRPVLTDSAISEIKDFYVKMRNKGGEEKAIKAIPISARQLDALIRLAESSAKIRLSDKVTKKDARRAIDLLTYCLMQVGLDVETGEIDIDRISTGVPASRRGKIFTIKDIILQLEARIGKMIPIDDVIKEALEKGIIESESEELIENLKRTGDLFEPRRGFVSRV